MVFTRENRLRASLNAEREFFGRHLKHALKTMRFIKLSHDAVHIEFRDQLEIGEHLVPLDLKDAFRQMYPESVYSYEEQTRITTNGEPVKVWIIRVRPELIPQERIIERGIRHGRSEEISTHTRA